MPSQESYHQAVLKQLLDGLIIKQRTLIDRLHGQSEFPLFVQEAMPEMCSVKLGAHIGLIEYADDEMKGGQTVSLQAVCGTDQATLALVVEINQQRADLHQHLMVMDRLMVRDESNQSVRLSVYALQQLGYSRFNRRQVVRRFNVFDNTLLSVSFFWASQRKITKSTVADVRTDLEKRISKANPDHAYYLKADLAHLNALDSSEDLYYVFQKNDNPRANYTLAEGQGQKRGSCMAANPFFYLSGAQAALPRIRELPLLSQRAPRLSRIDKIIDDTPYLPSIHVHRLLDAADE